MSDLLQLFNPSAYPLLMDCSYAVLSRIKHKDGNLYGNSTIAKSVEGVPFAIHRALFEVRDEGPLPSEIETVVSCLSEIGKVDLWAKNTSADVPSFVSILLPGDDAEVTLTVVALYDTTVTADTVTASTRLSITDEITHTTIEEAIASKNIAIMGQVPPTTLGRLMQLLAVEPQGGSIIRAADSGVGEGEIEFPFGLSISIVTVELIFTRGTLPDTIVPDLGTLVLEATEGGANVLTVKVHGVWHVIQSAITPYLEHLAGFKFLPDDKE